MLKPDKFIDIDKGKEDILNIIKSQIQKQQGSFDDTKQDEGKRNVWYLDTQKFRIKDNNFFLRIREKLKNKEVKGYNVTFKNRHKDRHTASSYDLSNPIKDTNFEYEKFEFKFEEDILTPFDSKFSVSTKFDFKQKPKIDTWQNILSVFPKLGISISPEEHLLQVNDFIAIEKSLELGSIIFKDGNKAKIEVSLWYLSNENTPPVIVEFDIDINSKDSLQSSGGLIDDFPPSLLDEIKTFYMEIQNKDIDPDAKKTKTEYAYEYKGQKQQ
jgi:hypothetical protein